MHYFFIILLLVNLIKLSHEYNYLVIPYKIYVGNNHEVTYRCFTEQSGDKLVLFKKILNNFLFLPRSYILLKLDGIHNRNIFNDTRNRVNYERVLNNDKIEYLHISQNKSMIQLNYNLGKMYFFCNKGMYSSYKCASECVDNLVKYSRFRSQEKVLGKDPTAMKIWNTVWKNCFYDCFSERKFDEMKNRFLKELNIYRMSVRSKPLLFNDYLSRTAQKRVDKILGKERYVEKSFQFKEISSIISTPFGNTQMNKWYNQYLNAKIHPHFKKTTVKYFQLLLSSKVKELGIGIGIKKNKLIIICRFK
uniref:CAP domain-containing protein n=1 Tax=Strongyloides stercoralis TaxID=6248 RepID=A0A0K0E212_STRER